MHGGTISAESKGAGSRATFKVRLPISAADQASVGKTQDYSSTEVDRFSRSELVDLSGIRVLLVDDDPDSRAMLRRILTGTGALARFNDIDVVFAHNDLSAHGAYPLFRRMAAMRSRFSSELTSCRKKA